MKQTKNQNHKGTGFTGTVLKNTIPRVDILDVNMTIFEVKQRLYEKLKSIWPEEH
jgi:hypothetical protein